MNNEGDLRKIGAQEMLILKTKLKFLGACNKERVLGKFDILKGQESSD